jgi:tRNA dimethylallyltransferase
MDGDAKLLGAGARASSVADRAGLAYNDEMLKGAFATAKILTGPTASGKSRFALELAKRLGAEIVSMDSMAVYRRMDIGTAKPTPAERADVPHHLVDVLDPWESASVAWWLEKAAAACREIASRGKTPLFVGGTPLYLKALLFGLFDGPAGDEKVRDRLLAEADAGANLHRRLLDVDPKAAQRIHPNDVRRVVRALEVFELTGRPISDWQTEWVAVSPASNDEPSAYWIDWPRDELYRRIEIRVDAMFAAGLVDEVRHLLTLPQPLSREARQALGYREVLEHLSGDMSVAQTVEAVKIHSRQFAKRQLTWFRNLPGCAPVRPELTGELWRHTM